MLKKLQENFEEIAPSLSQREALQEANRCLYCYDAPCIQACPTSIDIPTFIKKIASGNEKGAAVTIMKANPIGASCARVCPTEELCEGACVLNHETKPIMIGNLQRHATDWAIKNEQSLFQPGKQNGKKVAVIGGGPAGLSAARELAFFGYEVTIYEAEEEAGGLNKYGIVSFRLPQSIPSWEVKQVKSLGVTVKTNTRVGVDVSVETILHQYQAVVLAVGMGAVPNLSIEGEELEGVYDAIEFIKATKTAPISDAYRGKRVVVIGAGNTAIDGATCAVRLGAENVKILYRRTAHEMTAYPFEYEFAKQDGVEFRWLTAPVRIIGNENNQVKKIECIRMQLEEPTDGGRPRPVPVKGSEFQIETDIVLKAIGQTRYVSLLEQFQLEHNDGVVCISSSHETSHPNVFACGDVTFGKGKGEAMVVTAAQQGKETAYAVHKHLAQKPLQANL
ncbi:NAD(P)-dependent oxidoreductase [Microbacteriaceae bacterium 4G12]